MSAGALLLGITILSGLNSWSLLSALHHLTPPEVDVISSRPSHDSCVLPSASNLFWDLGNGQSLPAITTLPNFAALSFVSCQTGEVRIEVAGDDTYHQPVLLLGQLGTKHVEFKFNTPQTAQLNIIKGQRITLTYANDYDVLETRHLVVSSLHLRGAAACAAVPEIRVTRGVQWDDKNQSGLFSSNSQLSLPSCGVGELELKLWGLIGGGHGPHLTIRQGKVPLFSREIRGRQNVNIKIGSPERVTLDYEGGYFKVTQQRQMLVKGLDFIPEKQ